MSKRWRCVVAVAVLASGVAQAETGESSRARLEQSADLLLLGVPALALALTWVVDQVAEPDDTLSAPFAPMGVLALNGSPRHDLGVAMARTLGVTYGLKYAVDEQRPNGKDGSFPSAHTAVTFTGAEFIRKEYGWGWGAPAYAAASYVGWSRVETGHHWWRDVLAGAAIGVLSNHELSWAGIRLQPAILLPEPATQWRSTEPPALDDSAPGLRLQWRF